MGETVFLTVPEDKYRSMSYRVGYSYTKKKYQITNILIKGLSPITLVYERPEVLCSGENTFIYVQIGLCRNQGFSIYN